MIGQVEDYRELVERLARYMRGMADDIGRGESLEGVQRRLRAAAGEADKRLEYFATPASFERAEDDEIERPRGRGR